MENDVSVLAVNLLRPISSTLHCRKRDTSKLALREMKLRQKHYNLNPLPVSSAMSVMIALYEDCKMLGWRAHSLGTFEET